MNSTTSRDSGGEPDDLGHERALIEAARRRVLREEEDAELRAALREDKLSLVPRQIGRYRVCHYLASGGMARIFEAEQSEPRRRVALKVVKARDISPRALRRFEHEAHLLARLNHPGIAQVFDVGTFPSDEGPVPYFSMELVDGLPLTAYADQHGLDVRARLELFVRVCDAVQHAHIKGVVHRDLKPNNILVTSTGQPKILDFGVARAMTAESPEGTMHTQRGELVGTLPYMSPEQICGDPDDIDTRSDVYSLGVICHELLSGQLPHVVEGQSRAELQWAICHQPPARLGGSRRGYRRDLETIVGKALEKDPRQRYGSARELAEDVQRYLRSEPIVARPLGRAARLARWCRREPRVAALSTLLLLALVLLAVGALAAQRSLARAHTRTIAVSEQRRRSLFAARSNLALQAFERREYVTVNKLLRQLEPRAGETDLRSFEWYYLWRQLHQDERTLVGHEARLNDLAFSTDGELLASAGGDGVVIWRVGAWSFVDRIQPGVKVNCLRFAPGRPLLVTGDQNGRVLVWDVSARPARARQIHRSPFPIQALTFSSDGRWLACGIGPVSRLVPRSDHRGKAIVWDAATWQVQREFSDQDLMQVVSLDFSPDHRHLAMAVWGHEARVYELAQGALVRMLPAETAPSVRVAYTPDGEQLAVGTYNGEVRFWSIAEGKPTGRAPLQRASALALSPEGQLLCGADAEDPEIVVWDRQGQRVRDRLRGHTGSVAALTCSPEGRWLASAGADGAVKIWDLDRRHHALRLRGHDAEITAVAFSDDGRTLATSARDGKARVWDSMTGETQAVLQSSSNWLNDVEYLADPQRLVTCSQRGCSVDIWDPARGYQRVGRLQEFTGSLPRLAVSPDGALLAVVSHWDDGEHGAVHVYRTADWKRVWRRKAHGLGAWSVAFSPDGQQLATGGTDQRVYIWDARTGERNAIWKHSGWVTSLAFSPNGNQLAAGSWPVNKTLDTPVEVRVWHYPSGRLQHRLEGHSEAVFAVTFTPDAQLLVTGGGNGAVKLWDALTGEERTTIELGTTGWVFGLRFSPDGRTLACTAGSSISPGIVVLLEAATPIEVRQYERRQQASRPARARARAVNEHAVR